MTAWFISGAELLQQVARTLPDTIYTKQIVAEPGLWEKITSIASGVMQFSPIARRALSCNRRGNRPDRR